MSEELREMNVFTKQHIPLFGKRDWKVSQRVGVFFPHFMSNISFLASWLINRMNKGAMDVLSRGRN